MGMVDGKVQVEAGLVGRQRWESISQEGLSGWCSEIAGRGTHFSTLTRSRAKGEGFLM